MVWKGLQISFRCDTRRIYDWNETTPKRGLIREKNKMRRNSGDQIFIKIDLVSLLFTIDSLSI